MTTETLSEDTPVLAEDDEGHGERRSRSKSPKKKQRSIPKKSKSSKQKKESKHHGNNSTNRHDSRHCRDDKPIREDQPVVGETKEQLSLLSSNEINLVTSDVSNSDGDEGEPVATLKSISRHDLVETNKATRRDYSGCDKGGPQSGLKVADDVYDVAAKRTGESYGLLPYENQSVLPQSEEPQQSAPLVDQSVSKGSETEGPDESDLPLLENVDMDDEEEQLVKHEENKEGWSATLTENIYSLIYAANPNTLTFFFALFLFGFQASLMILALVDLIDVDSSNPLSVPADVTAEVRAAQFLALTLAIPLFGDVLGSVEALHEGYDDAILKQSRHATHWKWLLAFSLQFVVGLLYLATTFVLVVQSDRVISMFLNFAALGFISEIDDLAFSMARKGYVTEGVKRTCDLVLSLKTPDVNNFIFRRVAFLLIWIGLMATLSLVYSRQVDNRFLCQKLHVQFGDAFINYLPIYSGEYEITKNPRLDGRAVYVASTPGQTSHFRYCESERVWIFLSVPVSESSCGGPWELKSPETRGFDLIATDESQWLTKNLDPDSKLLHRVDYLTMSCVDCDESTCNGKCNKARNVCECTDEMSFGLGCRYVRPPCPKLEFDHRTSPFRNSSGLPAPSSTYDLLVDSQMKPVLVYNHPVYVSITFDGPGRRAYGIVADILVQAGRRYIATFFRDTDIYELPVLSKEAVLLDLIGYIRDFRYNLLLNDDDDDDDYVLRSQEIFPPAYISDPMDFGTASDTDSPVGLHWYLTQNIFSDDLLTPGPAVDTILLCAGCSEENECVWGDCDNATATCVCYDAFEGPHCEIESVRVAEPWCESCQEGYCRSETKTCDCYDGYTGENCTDVTDWCEACQFGYCDLETESCVCASGFEGDNCTNLASWCEACSPHHTLFCGNSTEEGCVCYDGYVGDTCEVKADWCIQCSPQGGICVAETESCECYRFGGYEGKNCDMPLPWCEGCSFQGGFCNGKTEKCECFDGYEGENCEVILPWCEVCVNGTCNGDTQGCDCDGGYEGVNCDMVLSWCEACSPNQVCNGENKTCDCRVGYGGELCDVPLPWCESCSQIGGSCDEITRSCVCKHGYFGVNCDESE